MRAVFPSGQLVGFPHAVDVLRTAMKRSMPRARLQYTRVAHVVQETTFSGGSGRVQHKDKIPGMYVLRI